MTPPRIPAGAVIAALALAWAVTALALVAAIWVAPPAHWFALIGAALNP